MPLPFVPIILGALPHLKKYWKEIAIVGIIGLAAYQNFSETRYLFWIETIPSLENRLEQSERNIMTLKDGNDVLTGTIDKRNAEIVRWKNISAKNAAAVIKLTNDLNDKRTQTNTKVKDILGGPTPVDCKAAIQYLRDGTEDIKW